MTHVSKWAKRQELKINIQHCIDILEESYGLTKEEDILNPIEKVLSILYLIKIK